MDGTKKLKYILYTFLYLKEMCKKQKKIINEKDEETPMKQDR
jgi:hypothetical protein